MIGFMLVKRGQQVVACRPRKPLCRSSTLVLVETGAHTIGPTTLWRVEGPGALLWLEFSMEYNMDYIPCYAWSSGGRPGSASRPALSSACGFSDRLSRGMLWWARSARRHCDGPALW